ncbi:MAG: putative aminohydrolase SsnA [Deltaproteobacteria bacterium]|nr:putative aminohydrolase SsnA [Deltaproteobacteria bacterium]
MTENREPRTLLVGPGTVFTPERCVPGGGVWIREGRVERVGEWGELRRRAKGVRLLDARGGIILPGFCNAHTHLYSALARGMSVPGAPARNFVQILERLWWRLDKALQEEDVLASAMVGLVECVRCGVTTIIDHHASPNACAGSLDVIRGAVEKVGLRASLCYEVSDRDGGGREGIEESVRFARTLRTRPSRHVGALMGVHALFTVSDDTLQACVAAAREEGLGLHLHVSEDRADVARNVARYGERPVMRLRRHGALGPRTLAAHCVHVDGREIGLLARTGTLVAHNPESNMNNAVGYAPVGEMLRRGVTVGLGTDGMTADVLREAKVAALVARHHGRDPRKGWDEVRRIAGEGTREVVGRVLGDKIGRLEKGWSGDLVVLDYDPPTRVGVENLWGHLQFGIDARHVSSVVAQGKVLMRERRLTTVDEREVMERARERAKGVWGRMKNAKQAMENGK